MWSCKRLRLDRRLISPTVSWENTLPASCDGSTRTHPVNTHTRAPSITSRFSLNQMYWSPRSSVTITMDGFVFEPILQHVDVGSQRRSLGTCGLPAHWLVWPGRCWRWCHPLADTPSTTQRHGNSRFWNRTNSQRVIKLQNTPNYWIITQLWING